VAEITRGNILKADAEGWTKDGPHGLRFSFLREPIAVQIVNSVRALPGSLSAFKSAGRRDTMLAQ
jgi:hypothetical protein